MTCKKVVERNAIGLIREEKRKASYSLSHFTSFFNVTLTVTKLQKVYIYKPLTLYYTAYTKN